MESVFVVARADFHGGHWPQGFQPVEAEQAPAALAAYAERGRFLDRAAAEDDPAHKQLIPYCVIRRPGQVFCVQRKRAQSETRLHGLLSIGLGGHVNPEAGPTALGPGLFLAALRRELDEELTIPSRLVARASLVGTINDDSNPVGSVHLGLVFCIDLAAEAGMFPGGEVVRVREISKMAGGFRSLADLHPLWQDPERFESWSRILLAAGVAGHFAPNWQRDRRRLVDGREELNHG